MRNNRLRAIALTGALVLFLFSFFVNARAIPTDSLVLMDLSAHPDDEDGATLAYYAKLFGVKTYSIFYTRGEGGQNEIGSELYDDLGRIRTKETLEAATILGTEVYFLGFPDFGFSKTAGETFIRWGGKDIVLERLVYFIRALKPDVIITNHDTITTLPDRQHGNHQAVGVSAYEAFDKAADSTFHPEQFQDPTIRPWQVKKLFFRFFGKGNPAQVVQINITKKDASGKDIQEISLDALAKHRSQGMDKTSIERIPEWFRKHTYALIRADQHYPPDAYDLFSGIQPSMRVIARLRAETVDFPSLLSLNVSPNFSVLERQDEKDKFQLRRNFTVTLVNNSDEEVPVDLSVTSDSRKIFYKSYQIPHGAFADKVTLTVTKSIAAQRQLLRFDALPGQSTPIEMKPVSKTVTLKPVHAEFEKKIAIGLVKTYDNTTEEVLQSFNISYRLIDSAMLAKGDLHKFTTIILDLRTYQYRADAVLYNDKLLEYVRKGGNIVCFYHKVGDWNGKQFAPYPITLTNERVTQEDAPVSILLPNHPFLNSPNIIRPEDWIGWVQERSIYLPADDTTKTSSYYTRLLAMSDSEERQPPTSILWSQYGKGSYAYVSLALYRQLRILNEGAVKLFFNLISQSRQPSKRGRRARD